MSALVRRIVAPVGLSEAASIGMQPNGPAWDVFVGAIPFMLEPSADAPFRIKAIGQTLYRYDTSNQAGEQTLGAWWLRSQTSFHAGAGQTFLDGTDPTISTDVASLRFNTCAGVDVWTPGEVSLLHDVDSAYASTNDNLQIIGALDDDTAVLLIADDSVLKRYDGTAHALTYGGDSGSISSVAQDGVNYYVNDGAGIFSGPLDGSADGTQQWTAAFDDGLLAWIKQRLMAALGTSIYELGDPGDSLPADLPDAKFTHPLSDWTWDAFADGPEAIYAAGHAGSQSVIYMFVLDDTGGVPTLTTGISALTLPPGVIVTSLLNHSDSWLGIGTDHGLYVATFQSGGALSVGLLPVDVGGSVKAIGAFERFLYVNYIDSSGYGKLARVDLSFEIKDGLFAYAPDLATTSTGDVTSIALYGDKIAFVVNGVGVFTESDDYVTSGTLTTSRVRYDTSEAKIFDAVRWHGAAPGSIACKIAIDSDSGGRNLGTLTAGSGFDSFDVPILAPGGGFATLVFTLKPSSSGDSPALNGWLLKALPMQSRSYQIMLPLRCYDEEKLGNGKTFGHTGWSLERVDAVMQMADQQKSQVLQQIAGPKSQRRAMRVVIDDIDYQQVLSPRAASRTGGLLYLTLRTV